MLADQDMVQYAHQHQNTKTQKRLGLEFRLNRLIRDTDEGKIKCNICTTSESWELGEEDKAAQHISRKHLTLSKLKTAQCPYCPKKLSSKLLMLIHLRLLPHRGGGGFNVTLCPESALKADSGKWGDLVTISGIEPEVRLQQ